MTAEIEKNADHEVGYGKPPKHTQFKKGQSGNPKGLKKPKTLAEAAAGICARQITVVMDGKRRRATVEEGILFSQAKKGLAGDHRAAKFLLELSQLVPPAQVEPTKEEIEQDFHEAIAGMSLDELRSLMDLQRRYDQIQSRRGKK